MWDAPAERSPRNAALRRAVPRVYADRLLALAADTAAAPDVRGVAAGASLEARAHWQALAGDIAAWERDRRLPSAQPLPPPPGDPFGEDEEF